MAHYVYILASRKHGTLYLGVTNDLVRRVYEHKSKSVDGFSKRYDIDNLVWFEIYDDALTAIAREKELKKWRRDWKIRLIEESNPNWDDLYVGSRLESLGASSMSSFRDIAKRWVRNPYAQSWLWIPGSLASLAPRNDDRLLVSPT